MESTKQPSWMSHESSWSTAQAKEEKGSLLGSAMVDILAGAGVGFATTALLVEEEFDAESLVAASREDFEELGVGAADCTRLLSYIARRQQAEKEEKARADEARRRREEEELKEKLRREEEDRKRQRQREQQREQQLLEQQQRIKQQTAQQRQPERNKQAKRQKGTVNSKPKSSDDKKGKEKDQDEAGLLTDSVGLMGVLEMVSPFGPRFTKSLVYAGLAMVTWHFFLKWCIPRIHVPRLKFDLNGEEVFIVPMLIMNIIFMVHAGIKWWLRYKRTDEEKRLDARRALSQETRNAVRQLIIEDRRIAKDRRIAIARQRAQEVGETMHEHEVEDEDEDEAGEPEPSLMQSLFYAGLASFMMYLYLENRWWEYSREDFINFLRANLEWVASAAVHSKHSWLHFFSIRSSFF